MAKPAAATVSAEESMSFMRTAARDALEKSGNDAKKAAALLEDRLLGDDESWELGIQAVLTEACVQMTRRARLDVRNELMSDEDPEAGEQSRLRAADATTRRLRTQAAHNMYHWPMSSGGWLGDAKKADVAKERDGYQARADANSARAMMFERIHAAMKSSKKTVREQLSAEKLEEIKKQNGVK